MKKLAFVLCLILVMSFFAACGDDTASDSSSGAAVDIFSTAAVNYAENGEAVYDIVRPENGNDTEAEVASMLFKQYRDVHGVKARNMSDADDGADSYEILIGNTNRPETATAREWLHKNINKRYDNYIVCTVGKKIVIYGNSEGALKNAVDYFIANFFNTNQSAGIKYTYTIEGKFEEVALNGVTIGEYSLVRPRINSSYLTYAEVEKLVESVYQKTGYMLSINDDTVTDEAEYEIIIGDCSRPNVTKIDNRDEYKVTVSGKKVFINGGSHQAVTVAVTEFAKKVAATDKLTDADSFAGSYAQTVATYDTTAYYTPKFEEHFDDISGEHVNENGLNTKIWKLTTAGKKGYGGYKAIRATDPEHVYVKDGLFQIHPYVDHETQTYYGGFLRCEDGMKFTYGYVEYSARIPDGPSFWSALWLRCTDKSGTSRPEIDIAECFGNSKTYSFNLHTWPGEEADLYGIEHTSLDGGKYPDKKMTCLDDKKFNDDFHTFGMLWTPDVAWATCDGVPYFKYTMGDKETDSWCFGKMVDICISLACGFEEVPGGADPNTAGPEVWNDTGIYYVDWVYVYQIDDGIQVMEYYK